MRVMYKSDCNKVKLQFVRNAVIGCDGSRALVTMDPYNSLEANIHKDLVGSGGAFMLVIDVRREDHSENKKKTFWGALKQYSKCYNIICQFKPHSRHVCQIVIIPYLFLCICNPR